MNVQIALFFSCEKEETKGKAEEHIMFSSLMLLARERERELLSSHNPKAGKILLNMIHFDYRTSWGTSLQVNNLLAMD